MGGYLDTINADEEEEEEGWTSHIPDVLTAYGDATEAAYDAQDFNGSPHGQHDGAGDLSSPTSTANSAPAALLPQLTSPVDSNHSSGVASSIPSVLPSPAVLALNRKPLSTLQNVQPPILPAQLKEGVLNQTVLVAKGSGDDNSLLPKPDHSVLNHLAASPIKGGLLAVGVTTRYRRKVSSFHSRI